jgi:hypothetical protein
MAMAERHAGELTYVEGFAHAPLIDRPFPLIHAWCVDRTGMVYERTWGFDARRGYFGIPFKLSYIRKIHRLTGEYGVLEQYVPGCAVHEIDPEVFLAK